MSTAVLSRLRRPLPDQTPTVRIVKVYAQLYSVDVRYMIVYGGRRSAKSFSVSQLLVRRAIEYVRTIVVMRKVANTLRLSVWRRVLSALEEAGIRPLCKVNKSERSIELPNGSVFHFVGADDPEKLKSIEGVTDYWLEEGNEFDEIDLDTIDAGLSADVVPIPQIWITFNPIPFVEAYVPWLLARFVRPVPHELGKMAIDRERGVCVLRTWYRHNPFCPEATIRLLESYKETNPDLYVMWALGEFTFLEGVIFKNWDVVPEVPEYAELKGYGLDFGFADDPLAVIKVWMTNRELWLQQRVYATELTNQEASAEMEAAGVRKRLDLIVGDSAEPKSIKELRQLGWFVVPCDKGPDYKRAAIRYLQGFKIHVLSDSPDLIKEFSTWSWKKDKVTGRYLPIPVDGGDHGIDATIYKTYTRRIKQWGVAA